jgi:hypothetical protein
MPTVRWHGEGTVMHPTAPGAGIHRALPRKPWDVLCQIELARYLTHGEHPPCPST